MHFERTLGTKELVFPRYTDLISMKCEAVLVLFVAEKETEGSNYFRTLQKYYTHQIHVVVRESGQNLDPHRVLLD